MFKIAALAALVVTALPVAAFAGDPVGHYTIEGKNPSGDGTYSGTAEVTQTGKTYKVVWKIGDDTYIGTAIGNSDFFAVSYKSGQNTGLALYAPKGNDWDGIWTYAGGKTMGVETWTRD